MKLKLKAEPILVCRPRLFWKLFSLMMIVLFYAFATILFATLIHSKFDPVISVFYFIWLIFTVFHTISLYPATIYLMPDSLIIQHWRDYEQIYWYEIDFIKVRRYAIHSELVIGSQLLDRNRLYGLLLTHHWHPVYLLTGRVLTNFDEALDILSKHLRHKLI